MPIHGYPGNIITANPTSPSVNSASGVWTTEQQMQAMAAGNWPMPLTQISRSLRFNSADSAYLNRTPGSAGNRKTWTWSGWVKRSGLGTAQIFWSSGTSNLETAFYFPSTDKLSIYQFNYPSYEINLGTTQVFRDVGAWYHIVIAVDTTQATSSNRVKLYVNGVQVTAFDTSTYPTLDLLTATNNNVSHMIGRSVDATGYYFPGYMTEVNFIDGLALTPASFGVADQATGVWGPRQYTGPYGTNGFYLNFSDNSGTTSTTLGKDYSGNGNNWTPNNFSVTAGAGNDSLIDTPTPYGTDTGAGGEVRGNYATLNPLDIYSSTSAPTFANGNLDASSSSVAFYRRAYGTFALFDNCYWEFTVGSGTLTNNAFGIASKTEDPYNVSGYYATEYAYRNSGAFVNNNSTIATYGSFSAGDIVRFAYSAGKLFVAINGTWQNSGNPAAGTGALVTGLTGSWKLFVAFDSTGVTHSLNAGQRPFAYTAPSGFKALCTQNLPTPTIGATSATQAGKYFNTVLYTGTEVARSFTGVGFAPDALWQKARSASGYNWLQSDIVMGANKTLSSDNNLAEASNQGPSSFDSDGWTVPSGSNRANDNGQTYVTYAWRANGAGSTNNAGSIQSTVSANTTAGFSIVTYTGTGNAGTIGHGLGVAPSMIFVKSRSAIGNWPTYHANQSATPQNGNLYLNLTDAFFTLATWNNTSPTSTVFSVNGAGYAVNNVSVTYVAYCFAPVAGYSAFGSYVANGSTDGNFIYTGMAPRFVLIKCSSTAENWVIFDTARDTYNVAGKLLRPNLSDAELNSPPRIDILSNGFKVRASGTSLPNTSGATYIYMALAANPFKYSLAR